MRVPFIILFARLLELSKRVVQINQVGKTMSRLRVVVHRRAHSSNAYRLMRCYSMAVAQI
jgi:hypothetical protein